MPTVNEQTELTEQELACGHRLASALFGLGKQQACIKARMSKAGTEHTAVVLLKTLAVLGPSRSSALAAAVHSDPSTVSRQVAVLVRDGLIERQADPEDGRATLLAATESGLALLAERRRQMGLSLARMLRHWDVRDLELFVTMFERFVTDHEQYLPDLINECVQPLAHRGGEHVKGTMDV